MGRDAHKLRAVLGRGATQAPDWGALTEQRRYLRMSGEPERYLGNPHLRPFIFDAKGRPYSDANSRRELDELNDALNAVTGILNHNAEITSEEQRLKYEDAGEKYGEEVVSVHFPSAVHAMCLNVSAIMNLYIGTIRRRLLTFESPDTVLSMLPNKFGSHELQSLVSSGSSGLVFWFFVVKHGLLERSMAFVQYVPIDGSQIRPTSRPWQVTISKAAVLISIRFFSFFSIMNAQMQDLQLFPPISSTNPMPLYTWLQSLSRPDRRRCLYLALLPIYLGYHIFDTHMLPHLTHGIATCFEFYQNTGGMLPSSTHKQMAEYKRQKLHNTSGYDLPLRAMLSHAAHSMSIVSNIWRMSLTRKFWLHPWLSLSLPAEHALRPRGPVGFEDIKGSSIAEVRLWPNDFYRRAFIGLAQDFVLFPVAGLASRLAANWLLRDPAISRLPQAPSVQARLRPLLPGQGLFSIDGLRSFGSLMGQVAMTFLLQTAVKTVLVCVESMVALGVSRYRLAGKKRIFALGAAQHEQEDRQ